MFDDPTDPPPPDEPAFDEPLEPDGPAWEHWRELGFIKAWMTTIGDVLMRPTATFGNMRREGGFGSALGFFILTGMIVQMIGFFLSFAVQSTIQSILLGYLERNGQTPPVGIDTYLHGYGFVFGGIILLILGPIGLLISLFIASAISHLALLMIGGARRSFETTLRTMAYAGGTASILGVIPFCGFLFAIVGGVILKAIGLTCTHETDTWRGVLAACAPYILAVLLYCCLFTLMIVAFTGLSSSQAQGTIQQLF